jgi:hypothetical protein
MCPYDEQNNGHGVVQLDLGGKCQNSGTLDIVSTRVESQ